MSVQLAAMSEKGVITPVPASEEHTHTLQWGVKQHDQEREGYEFKASRNLYHNHL